MYVLHISDKDHAFTFDVPRGETILGRTEECGLVLDDPGVSRQHARLKMEGPVLTLEDLSSKNGTRLNGQAMHTAILKAGDVLDLGRFRVSVQQRSTAPFALSENHAELERSVVVDVTDLQRSWSDGSLVDGAARLADPAQVMRVLNNAAETLVGTPPMEKVLDHVLQVVFEQVPAERAFLLMLDPATNTLIPMAARYRRPELATGAITVSRTLVDYVFKNRVALVTADAVTDGRFAARQSIMINAIRSAMVAPVWNKDQVMGVIHVDTSHGPGAFDKKQLDLLCAMANYAAVAIERARLHQRALAEQATRERFRRFLSPQVAQRLLSMDPGLGANPLAPEMRDVSILFCDLVGFTSMAEGMGPQELAAFINSYFEAMTDEIFRFDGTLDKYIGDALMAVFGAPLSMPDHAQRAVGAALAMRDRLERFNAQSGRPPLRSRVGINSGRVMAGEMGGPAKREYTVLGDTVNVAARLESSVAKPGMVVVGSNTYEQIKDHFVCTPLGSRALKGRTREEEAYEVVSARNPAE
jgi:adenylate cyclase